MKPAIYLLMILLLISFASAQFTDNMVAYYTFETDEITDDYAAYDGTNNGANTEAGHALGDWLYCDGNDYVSLPEAILEDTDFTVCLYKNATDGDAGSHMALSSGPGSRAYMGCDNNDEYYRFMDGSGNTTDSCIDDTIYHMCYVWDKSELDMTVYKNGVQIDFDDSATTSGDPTQISHCSYGLGSSDFWTGTVDEVAIWNDEKNASTILAIYNHLEGGDHLNSAAAGTKNLYVDVDSIGGACNNGYTRAQNNLTQPWCSIETAFTNYEDGDTIIGRDGEEVDYSDGFDLTTANLHTNQTIFTSYQGEMFNLSCEQDAADFGPWNCTDIGGGQTRCDSDTFSTGASEHFYREGNSTDMYFPFEAGEALMNSYSDMADPDNPFGCFFYENGASDLYQCRFPSGVDPDNAGTIMISKQSVCLYIRYQQQEGVRFSNMTIKGGKYGIYTNDIYDSGDAGTIEIDGMTIIGAGERGIEIADSQTGYFHNNFIETGRAEYGNIWLWLTHVKGSGIENTGIFVNGNSGDFNDDIRIQDNEITGFFNGIMIYDTGSGDVPDNIIISDNYIRDGWDDGIEIEEYGTGYRIYRNIVTDTPISISAVDFDSYNGQSYIYNNLLISNKSFNWSPGVTYIGEVFKFAGAGNAARNITIHDNTCYGRIVYANGAYQIKNTIFYNNVFYGYNRASSERMTDYGGQEMDDVDYDYNIYYNSGGLVRFRRYGLLSDPTEYTSLASAVASGNAPSWDGNSQEADPLLNNTGHPYPTSPVCGAGLGGTDIGYYNCTDPGSLSITLDYPVNGTNYSNFSGWINLTINDLNPELSCDVSSAEYVEQTTGPYSNEVVAFYDSDVTTTGNISMWVNCYNLTHEKNTTFWFWVQSWKINASDYYTGDAISTFTANVSGFGNYTTASGLINTGVPLNYGSNVSVLISKTDYITQNLSLNPTATYEAQLYQHLLTVYAYDSVTNQSLSSFTVETKEQSYAGTNGVATVYLNASTHIINITSTGYTAGQLNVTVTADNTSNQTVFLDAYITVNIRTEVTDEWFNTNETTSTTVTFFCANGTIKGEFNTTANQHTKGFDINCAWDFIKLDIMYNDTSYFRTLVPEYDERNITFYALDLTEDLGVQVILKLNDLVGDYNEGQVYISKYISGTEQYIIQQLWDMEAQATLYLLKDSYYTVRVVNNDGTITRTIGLLIADAAEEKTITIPTIEYTPDKILGNNISWAWQDTSTSVRLVYNDTLNTTQSLVFSVYYDNLSLAYRTTQYFPNTATFTYVAGNLSVIACLNATNELSKYDIRECHVYVGIRDSALGDFTGWDPEELEKNLTWFVTFIAIVLLLNFAPAPEWALTMADIILWFFMKINWLTYGSDFKDGMVLTIIALLAVMSFMRKVFYK